MCIIIVPVMMLQQQNSCLDVFIAEEALKKSKVNITRITDNTVLNKKTIIWQLGVSMMQLHLWQHKLHY